MRKFLFYFFLCYFELCLVFQKGKMLIFLNQDLDPAKSCVDPCGSGSKALFEMLPAKFQYLMGKARRLAKVPSTRTIVHLFIK